MAMDMEIDMKSCPLCYGISIFSGKWKPSILFHLYLAPNNTARYGELKRDLPWKVSHRVFSTQLQELERDGMITREKFEEEKTPRVEYSLTDKAKRLLPALLYIRDWASLYDDTINIKALNGSHGQWTKNQITYGFQAEDDQPGSVQIVLDVGFPRDKLPEQDGYDPDYMINYYA